MRSDVSARAETIGGFFELEIRRGAPYHRNAVALSSGRACLAEILRVVGPSRAWVPFYVCDTALAPFERAGIPTAFYDVDERLDPSLPPGAPTERECLLYVNYFGLKGETAAALAAAHPRRVIVDDTQAFYACGYTDAWSFNSARKFFGVPDGAYAYGPGLTAADRPRVPDVHYDHLVNRLLGHQRTAFDQFQRSEAAVSSEPWRMSALAERLLAGIDYDDVCTRRQRNYAVLHRMLGDRNRLRPIAAGAFDRTNGADAPFCYPLFVEGEVPWSTIWSRHLFVPRLWPDLAARTDGGFAWERRLADHVLPLPVDQRYGPDDMNMLADALRQVLP